MLVRVRFKGAVPRGHVTLDGAKSAAFRERSEEFAFVVDPRGTHRVELVLDERATIDWLSVASTESTIIQESCSNYEFDSRRRVDLAVDQPESVNRFETEEERRAREAEERRRRDEDLRRDEERRREETGYPTTSYPDTRPASGAGAVIPAGTEMSLTLQNEIDTRNAYVGQNFTTTLDHDVLVNGKVALPSGTRVEGHVVETQDAGRFGRSKLKLGFDRATLRDGTSVPLQGTVQRLGKGSAAKQGGIIAGSAVGGAILGKVLGGSDGALLGAILGGGIAAGSIGAKEGEPIVVPAGSVLTISLDNNAQIPYPPSRR
jgi:hypothetical protein